MAQYVYTMNRVGKVVPPNREILSTISLSFFPGAKIGVLGLNGAGKFHKSMNSIKALAHLVSLQKVRAHCSAGAPSKPY